MSTSLTSKLREIIRIVPDFPKQGINYYDITTLLSHVGMLRELNDAFESQYAEHSIDCIAGIEARGFIFGAMLAERLNCSFIPVRKPGKLPFTTESVSYSLEYGQDTLEVHSDAVNLGDKVLIIDDLLATGGTAAATASLLKRQGAEVLGCGFVVELAALKGREALDSLPVFSLLID